MKCRHCGMSIGRRQRRYVLSIMDDPVLCSPLCVKLYIRAHQEKVNEYIETYMTTVEVPNDLGEEL